MTRPHLEPIKPDTAVAMYLDERQNELATHTLRSHRGRLESFTTWCEESSVTNLNDLTSRDLRRYKIWRSSDVKPITVKTHLNTLRVFLRWAVDIDAVDPELPDKIQSPTLRKGEDRKTRHIDTETAEAIIEHLRKYEYASLPHVEWELLWHTQMRRGTARSIDLKDLHLEDRYVDINHRPETGTPLKNKQEGERPVSLSETVTSIISDWIADQRPDVTDDHGREPLLTTKNGRVHGQTIQAHVYAWSRPCVVGAECPHEREPDECEGAKNQSTAHLCPASIAPHDVRRSAITHALRKKVSKPAVSERADVSADILDKHYDQMTDIEKMEQRRDFFDNI